MSLKELKNNLKDAMRKSGAVHSVKAQLRSEFIANLTDPYGKAERASTFAASNLRERLMLSALYNSLRARGMKHACSVFVAECGMDKNSTLTAMDIVEGLNFGYASDVYKAVEAADKEGTMSNVFDLLMNETCKRLQTSSSETSIQTETAGRTAREMLDIQTSAARERYEKVLSSEKASPQASMQERMLQYQNECDERMKKDLEGQMRHFRDTEALKIRLDESRKARVELDAVRREMDLEYERRLAASTDREKEVARQHAERERQLEASQYEYRQRMQRELDELRMRETAATKKGELDAQGAALLEQRLRETQIRIETRERELSAREAEVDARARDEGDRAKAEAMAQLREQMEVVARERFQIKEDRDVLDDSKAAHKQLLDSAKDLKKRLRDALQLAAEREDELDTKNRMVQRLEAHHKEDDTEYAALAAATGGLTRPQHLLKLVRQNAELQARCAVQGSRIDALEADHLRLEAADSLLKRRDLELNHAGEEAARDRARHAEELRDVSMEVEALKRSLRAEKARAGSARVRVEELEKLLQEQRTLVARLGKLQMASSGRQSSGAALANRPGDAAARLRTSLGMDDVEAIFKVAAASRGSAGNSFCGTGTTTTAAALPAAAAGPSASTLTGVSLADIGAMVDQRLRTSLQSFGRSSAESLPAYSPSAAEAAAAAAATTTAAVVVPSAVKAEPTVADLEADSALHRRRAEVAAETARVEAELAEQQLVLQQTAAKLARERDSAAAAEQRAVQQEQAQLAHDARERSEAAAAAAATTARQVAGDEARRQQQEADEADMERRKQLQQQERQVAADKRRREAEAEEASAREEEARRTREAEVQAAAAAASEEDKAVQQKKDADMAAVAEARAKVLARRKQRAAREGAASAPPPLPAEQSRDPAPGSNTSTSRRLSGQDETHDFDSNSVNSLDGNDDGGAWF
jgi:oral-facial-digital syndrome 1 protein